MDIKCSYEKLEPIHKLVKHPRNANTHPDRQIELLAKIIDHTGFRHPIIVSKLSGFIVAGHGRLQAAEKLGFTEVPVEYQDFKNEAEEFAFLIADNKISELAKHDDNLMIESIKDLNIDDLELLGLNDFSIEIKELNNTSAELDLDSFDNFQHECPKCGFEWDDNGSDNS